MALEENVSALLAYGIQSDISTVATAGGASQYLRRVSSTLNGMKDQFASNEVRSDQQISDMRHGGRKCGGAISGELSTQTYDDLFSAVMRAAWVAGVALTQSDFTSLTIASGVWTAASGNLSTLGLRVGHIIDVAGLSVTANNDRYRITTMPTSSTFTAIKVSDGSTPADNTADTSCSITVVGKTLKMGTTKYAFTFEHNYPTVDVSEVFKHCRIGGMSVRLPPNGIATIDFDVQGRDWSNVSAGSAPYFTGPPTAAPNTNLLTGIDGAVRVNATEMAIVTGIDFNLALNMSSAPVIGSQLVPDIHYGRSVLTGNLSYFLQDKTLLDVFYNETEVDLLVSAKGSDGSFLTFNMQRIKLAGAQKQIGAEGGVLVQAPFQALLKTAATGYDATTLSMQRSNS